MTIDIRTAAAKQLAEYISTVQGYFPEGGDGWWSHTSGLHRYIPRFVADLNLIADAMPPGWDWSRDKYQNWIGCRPAKKRLDIYGYRAEAEVVHTGNERLDRLRLAALAWEVESKEVSK